MKEKIFALYKDDECIDIGTAKEIAKRRGVTPKFIKYLSTPSNLKRIEKRKNKNKPSKAMICVKIEEEDEK